MKSNASIEAFLAEPAIAVVGVSRSGKGFGNVAVREPRRKGYRIYRSIGEPQRVSRPALLPQRTSLAITQHNHLVGGVDFARHDRFN